VVEVVRPKESSHIARVMVSQRMAVRLQLVC
jgi:hypothetical protein